MTESLSAVQEVWVPDKERVWARAKIIAQNPDGSVTVKDGVTYQLSDICMVDATHLLDREDLCSMNLLHEAPLLDTLRRRHAADSIYTTADSILISINPYKTVPGLYDAPCMYLNIPEIQSSSSRSFNDDTLSKTDLAPHVFFVANAALAAMIVNSSSSRSSSSSGEEHNRFVNQSVVVSGESGAGKTEASKKILQFLIAADAEVLSSDSSGSTEQGEKIKEGLVSSNMILEQFGNSKTIRNDNSSRFGKYIKLFYSEQNQLVSATTQTFLLEKSRLVERGTGERCYHIFYCLLKGLKLRDAELATSLGLNGKAPTDFAMLVDNKSVSHVGEEDDQFEALCEGLSSVGVSEAEKSALWSLLAMLLHLCNVQFLADGTIVSPSLPLEEIARLLGLDCETFKTALTRLVIQAGGRVSVHNKQLTPEESKANLLALVKTIYSAAFDWVVRKINHSLGVVTNSRKSVAILDIFGFEILQCNSLEQLFINFCNERLQNLFNTHVFVKEQEEYKAQGLDWTSISFQDNAEVIDVFSKKGAGLFALLEEQAMLQRNDATTGDSALLANFAQRHGPAKVFSKSRFNLHAFVVSHFAGPVEYLVTNFLVKNNDALVEDLVLAVLSTTNTFVYNVMASSSTGSGLSLEAKVGEPGFIPTSPSDSSLIAASGAPAASRSGTQKKMAATNTVSFNFRSQLDSLVATLKETELHFVKCFKPNNHKSPLSFDAPLVIQQLRYSGALEVVRIRREGYPWSALYIDFIQQFFLLTKSRAWKATGRPSPPRVEDCINLSAAEATQLAVRICDLFLPAQEGGKARFAAGQSKLFLRDMAYDALLVAINAVFNNSATRIQAQARAILGSRRFQSLRKANQFLQRVCRGWSARLHYRREWLALQKRREEERIRLQREQEEKQAREIEQLRLEEEERERVRLAEVARLERQAELERRQREAEEEERARLQKEAEENERERARLEEIARLERLAEQERLRVEEERSLRVLEEKLRREAEERELARLAEIARLEKERLEKIEALHLAAACGDVAFLLASFEAEPTNKQALNAQGMNLLQTAVSHGQNAVVEALKPTQVDLSHRCKNGGLNSRHYAGLARDVDIHKANRWLALQMIVNMSAALAAAASSALEADKNKSRQSWSNQNQINANVLREGWLMKRGETSAWRRRYVRLSADALRYYHSPKDALPRDTISLQLNLGALKVERFVGPSNAPGITVRLAAVSAKKQRQKIDLLATNEEELQSWITPLKALSGIVGKTGLRSHAAMPEPCLIDVASRTAALTATTTLRRDNLLHIAFSNREEEQGQEKDPGALLLLVSWLVDVGVSATQANCDGKTPQELAAAVTGGKGLAALLQKALSAQPSRPSFPIFPAYTYVSIFFGALTLGVDDSGDAAKGDVDLRLTVALLDGMTNKRPVEDVQVLSPLAVTSGSIVWGQSVFLKTPVDNVADQFVLSVEFRNGQSLQIDAHPDRIDSGNFSLPLSGGAGTLTFTLSLYRGSWSR